MSIINTSRDIIPISEAKRRLGDICRQAAETRRSVIITRHGRGVAAIVSVEELEELEEHRRVAELERGLRAALTEVEAGAQRPFEEVERRLARYLDDEA